MAKTIFVNLPVADVAASTAFYTAIGMKKDDRFSNESASAMVWSDTISFMLLSHDFYGTFTSKTIADEHGSSEVMLCLSQDDRGAVDAITEAALAAGGREPRPVQDEGFMYGRAFEDLDGHIFEPMFMDIEAAMAVFRQSAQAPA